jgi:ABC-type lipoprotein export system ATPase subunit
VVYIKKSGPNTRVDQLGIISIEEVLRLLIKVNCEQRDMTITFTHDVYLSACCQPKA